MPKLRARMPPGRGRWLPLAILVLLLGVGLVTSQYIPFKCLDGMACADGIKSLPTFATVSHRPRRTQWKKTFSACLASARSLRERPEPCF